MTRVSLDELQQMKDETDWERLRNAPEPPWDPEEDFEVDWEAAEWVEPGKKTLISLRVDPDLLAFFKAQGKGYQSRMHRVLRAYMMAKTARRPPK